MKYDVAKLDGHMLDAAVAKAEGFDYLNPPAHLEGYAPSRAWVGGSPIIEREKIRLEGFGEGDKKWYAHIWLGKISDLHVNPNANGHGPTPLIAAMRAYVTAIFGDTVELP